jgi:hypothetical protein
MSLALTSTSQFTYHFTLKTEATITPWERTFTDWSELQEWCSQMDIDNGWHQEDTFAEPMGFVYRRYTPIGDRPVLSTGGKVVSGELTHSISVIPVRT